ncbi:hypothetical protein SBD_7688 [Streptomyces bottropensis ATCC 25435]|uniref:Uncharacterized protein n=1 Tax=Streptomyces bottropensis ATCC 25435 TaxID=1054862 RepID=M3E4U2_9ACTN|nr:hypothetical protein SBD_7688 [Streptomyces bottropensis ATCC 25435]
MTRPLSHTLKQARGGQTSDDATLLSWRSGAADLSSAQSAPSATLARRQVPHDVRYLPLPHICAEATPRRR